MTWLTWLLNLKKKARTKKKAEKHFTAMGCKPSPEDPRDYPLRTAGLLTEALPNKNLPLTSMTNQANTNSCVGFAIINAYVTARRIAKRESYELDCSEAFTYYKARELSGLQDRDQGSFIRDGLKTAQNDGISLEQYHPFNPLTINTVPDWLSTITAKALRIKNYYRLLTLQEVKLAISNNFPVIVGMRIDKTFLNYKGGVYESSPSGSEEIIGLHAMCLIGYNNETGAVFIKNSWGRNWGSDGYVWYSYASFMKDQFEMWAVNSI